MSLVSSLVTDAFRESNLVAIVSTPNATEMAEGVRLYNRLLLSVIGNDAGQELTDLNVGGEFDQFTRDYAPENTRLVLNLAAGRTIKLHPYPYDGQRVAIADAGGNLATNPLILDGNGRQIEGSASVTLNTDGEARQWMYRADLGNWVRLTELASSDEAPFPVEFDDYFTTRLALRLAPRNSYALPSEVAAAMQRAEVHLAARYRKPVRKNDNGALGLMGQQYGGSEASLYGRGQ